MLGQTVDCGFQKSGGIMVSSVPAFVDLWIPQPEIRRHIDYFHFVRKARDDVLRRAMGQAAKGGVNLSPIHFVTFDEIRKTERLQMRKDTPHLLAGMGIGRKGGNFYMRMTSGKPDQIRTRIAGGANDRDPNLILSCHECVLLSNLQGSHVSEFLLSVKHLIPMVLEFASRTIGDHWQARPRVAPDSA